MKIFYFTATGNSLYVAKRIKEKINDCELVCIPKISEQGEMVLDDDVIGFVYPIHYAGVPITMYDFLSKLKIKRESYVFAVGVSGGGSSNTSFYQINKLIGRNIDNCLSIKYTSNYLKLGTNPSEKNLKDAIAKYDDKIEEFIEVIGKRQKKSCKFVSILGKYEYRFFKDTLKNKDKKFNSNDNCNGCGICTKICPAENISIIDNKPKWNGKCIDCMACINICPKKAINIGNSTVNKNRYRNPYISLSELIRGE